MIYFNGECYGYGALEESFEVQHENRQDRYELLNKIIEKVAQYTRKYDLVLPIKDWAGTIWSDENDHCNYVYLSMIESNAFNDEKEFDMIWEGAMKALGRGKL